jgi:hypothetical protein
MASVSELIRMQDALTSRHEGRYAVIGGQALSNFIHRLSDDVVNRKEEFDGAASSAVPAPWVTNAGTGATAFAVPSTPLQGGAIRGSSGTDATGSNRRVNLYGPPILLGNNGVLLVARLKLSAITSVQFEMGLIDTMTTITTPAPAVTDIDSVPTFAAGLGDAAVIAMDTSQTLTTLGLACKGSSAVNAGSTDSFGGTAPVAATYMTFSLGVINNVVYARIDHKDGSTFSVVRSSGINGATLVRPWFFLGGLIATNRDYDIDMVHLLMDR